MWGRNQSKSNGFFFPRLEVNDGVDKSDRPTVGGKPVRPFQSEVRVACVSDDKFAVREGFSDDGVNSVVVGRRETNTEFIFDHQCGDVLSEVRLTSFGPNREPVAVPFLRSEWNTKDELHVGGLPGTELQRYAS